MSETYNELLVVFDGERDVVCTDDDAREVIDDLAAGIGCEADDIVTERVYLWVMDQFEKNAFLDDTVEFAEVTDRAQATIDALREERKG